MHHMKMCITCGMPLEGDHANDVGMETSEGPVCKYDIENGQIKSPEDIFEGGVQYFSGSITDGDRALAERVTRTNMKHLPYWQSRPFALLEGPTMTEAEFGAAMAKLN